MSGVSTDYARFNGSGHDLEDAALYPAPWNVDANRTGYLPMHEAYSRLRANQPEGWDPTDPPTRIASDIQALVCERYDIDDYSDVRLYTAIGSSLDKHHGIDAWVEFHDQVGYEPDIVTLDFTLNSGKYLNKHKADVIVLGNNPEVAADDVVQVLESRYVAA
jgi:hypothetical protein